MTQEEKDLLLKDLCARLPYGVVCKITLDAENIFTEILDGVNVKYYYKIATSGATCNMECMEPYLRPMSSMTEEEEEEFISFTDTMFRYGKDNNLCCLPLDAIQWLLKNHFDYRGLIEKGLAIEAPEGMYRKENEL